MIAYLSSFSPKRLLKTAMVHKISASIGLFIVASLLIIGILALIRGSAEVIAPVETPKTVSLINVGAFSQGATSISVVGQVRSEAQADIHTQKSGQVTRVAKKIGDYVSAGEIIAEIENASERAALLSAQGGLEAAQAQKSIFNTNAKTADTSLASAEVSARNTLRSAYASVDSAVRTTADSMISNPQSALPVFIVRASNSQLPVNIVNKRVALSPILARQIAAPRDLTGTALRAEIQRTQSEVQTTLSMFDDIIGALNTGIATYDISDADIAAYLASATGARTTLLATASGLSGALDTLDAREAALEIAQKNSEAGTAASTADASVKQAEGALAAARANYERSIIRSPISGVVNAIHFNRGDFVQMSAPAAEVANNRALEIVASVTEADAREIQVGTTVILENKGKGVVTRIAPVVSNTTKKIEVRIGVTQSTELTNGDSITITFERKGGARPLARILIPITALKVGAEGMSVLMLDTDLTLTARAVEIGTLLGDKVVVLTGLTPTESIIADARGLRAGEEVSVQ